jgi:hypothetical protein
MVSWNFSCNKKNTVLSETLGLFGHSRPYFARLKLNIVHVINKISRGFVLIHKFTSGIKRTEQKNETIRRGRKCIHSLLPGNSALHQEFSTETLYDALD